MKIQSYSFFLYKNSNIRHYITITHKKLKECRLSMADIVAEVETDPMPERSGRGGAPGDGRGYSHLDYAQDQDLVS